MVVSVAALCAAASKEVGDSRQCLLLLIIYPGVDTRVAPQLRGGRQRPGLRRGQAVVHLIEDELRGRWCAADDEHQVAPAKVPRRQARARVGDQPRRSTTLKALVRVRVILQHGKKFDAFTSRNL